MIFYKSLSWHSAKNVVFGRIHATLWRLPPSRQQSIFKTKKIYVNWHRVLRLEGIFINFDAEYGKVFFAQQAEEKNQPNAHATVRTALLEECDAIKAQLNISSVSRPQWDGRLCRLEERGFTDSYCDDHVSDRISIEVDEAFNPVPVGGKEDGLNSFIKCDPRVDPAEKQEPLFFLEKKHSGLSCDTLCPKFFRESLEDPLTRMR